jgi:hypothetical protein
MTQPSRTIDNLGVEVSTRYAEDRALLDEAMIKEAQSIPVQAGIEVTAPSFPSEVEALLRFEPTHVTWASFIAPPQYFEQRKRLFTYQLIPSMGSDDKKESQALKILSKLRAREEELTKKEAPEGDKRVRYEKEREIEDEQREQKTLTSLLNTIAVFDKLIIEINSRRSQYQKG